MEGLCHGGRHDRKSGILWVLLLSSFLSVVAGPLRIVVLLPTCSVMLEHCLYFLPLGSSIGYVALMLLHWERKGETESQVVSSASQRGEHF